MLNELDIFDLLATEVGAIYLQSVVALVVGLLASVVYRTQKRDNKEDAANTLLLEIQGGETAITKVRDAIQNSKLDIDILVLPHESWSKSKHLFVRDFDRDEWDQISDFYNKAFLIDQSLQQNRAAFVNDVEQIRTNKQRILATYAEEAANELSYADDAQVDEQSIKAKYDAKAKIFDELYMGKQADFRYNPAKPIDDAQLYLTDLPKLTTSSVGVKLKRIAGLENK